MSRFCAYRLKSGMLVLDCQADILSHLKTRLVVPLLELDRLPSVISGLHPVFEIDGKRLVMATQLASAIPANEFREEIASLDAHATKISNALDLLLTGV